MMVDEAMCVGCVSAPQYIGQASWVHGRVRGHVLISGTNTNVQRRHRKSELVKADVAGT